MIYDICMNQPKQVECLAHIRFAARDCVGQTIFFALSDLQAHGLASLINEPLIVVFRKCNACKPDLSIDL